MKSCDDLISGEMRCICGLDRFAKLQPLARRFAAVRVFCTLHVLLRLTQVLRYQTQQRVRPLACEIALQSP